MKGLKLTIGSDQEGLGVLLRPYQALLLSHLWKLNRNHVGRIGLSSGEAYKWLADTPEKKSRASVIFFLNDMVEEGILEFEEKTGKGGYHRIYYPTTSQREFWVWLAKRIKDTLVKASGLSAQELLE